MELEWGEYLPYIHVISMFKLLHLVYCEQHGVPWVMKVGGAVENINFRQDFVCQTTGNVSAGLL